MAALTSLPCGRRSWSRIAASSRASVPGVRHPSSSLRRVSTVWRRCYGTRLRVVEDRRLPPDFVMSRRLPVLLPVGADLIDPVLGNAGQWNRGVVRCQDHRCASPSSRSQPVTLQGPAECERESVRGGVSDRRLRRLSVPRLGIGCARSVARGMRRHGNDRCSRGVPIPPTRAGASSGRSR